MKKFIFIWLIIGIWVQGLAQGKRTVDSLNRIINDNSNSPESRVLSCVRQGQFYINKPGEDPKDIDSASVYLKQGQQLSKAFNLHTTDGELLFLASLISKEKGLHDDASRLNSLALTFLEKKPGDYFLGCALLEKGDFLNTDDDRQLNEKIVLLKEATTCFAGARYVRIRAGVWKSLGDLYGLRKEATGNIALALDAYQRSMDCYFSYGYKNVQDIYIELADIYTIMGDDQQGLRYCLMAVQTAERARDSSMTMCQIYNNTALIYLELSDNPNAKKYFVEAMNMAERLNNKDGIFSIGASLYYVYMHDKEYNKTKHLIDKIHSRFPEKDPQNQYFSNTFYLRYYTTIKDPTSGNKYCLQLIKLIGSASPAILRYTGREAYSAISEYYAMARDFNNAYKYWGKSYVITLQYNNAPANKSYLLYSHYKIDTASHNLASAILFLERYTTERDSIYTTSKAAQEANLKVVYDTKKKEDELADSRQKIQILTQNEQLQRANLKQAVLIRNITIAFTIIVIIVSALLYRMVILHKKAIRKIAKTNSLLEKLVSEKEWLLREIHHRVKNNLHTVICLLESQAAYLEKDALKAIDDSRHRIYAMSLIHQKLYENEDVKTIDINDFVTALVHYLQDIYDLNHNITFRLEIAPVLIDTSIAIPIGLIINEAVTNSIKYAFTKNDGGQITIKLAEEREKIVVIVADNGLGIDLEVLNKPNSSMGLRLIRGLCGDIGGKVLFNNKGGTEIRLICNRVLVDEEVINIEELLNDIPDAIES
ncbi:MAG TPA: histidine kinase dimerization/phosphoacceptor domain -containing protein [Mucilaginibacter sp.]|jgi:two-component sensor histidine kinase|nr:histidine kinase dimerization/phosphoacceptor domain -containing protein [Mucilaginibacter sp.]